MPALKRMIEVEPSFFGALKRSFPRINAGASTQRSYIAGFRAISSAGSIVKKLLHFISAKHPTIQKSGILSGLPSNKNSLDPI
jgi:hypothetical protein